MARDLAASTRDGWTRLEGWCKRHHPRLLSVLNSGASKMEIDALQHVIGQPLPLEVRESLVIHNGESGRSSCGFIFGDTLLSVADIESAWRIWQDCLVYNDEFRDGMESFPERAVALDYANPGWIPLTRDAGSNHIGVDLAPGSAGAIGQVILFGRDENRKCVLASRWAEFLTGYADFLESGVLRRIDHDPDVWRDTLSHVLGDRHRHDVLRDWRQQGRWPPHRGSSSEAGAADGRPCD